MHPPALEATKRAKRTAESRRRRKGSQYDPFAGLVRIGAARGEVVASPPVPTKPAAADPRFDGFADSKLTFFRSLAKHQDREWFASRKGEYEEGWHKPMLALLTEARAKL